MKKTYRQPEVKSLQVSLRNNILLEVSADGDRTIGSNGGWTNEEDDSSEDWK